MISLKELADQTKSCPCGNRHYRISIDEIVVGNQALEDAVQYIKDRGFQHAIILADEHTYKAAGEHLSKLLNKETLLHQVVLINPNEQNDVIADEVSLIQAMLGIPQDADIVIAVGSGTIHDIARFASYKMGKPFISVPTAPSVDGFNSMGAPVVIKGFKTTYQMHSPIALFADLSILKKAPKEMIAAGFGDMIGKYTSLADWKFSHLVADEPYCPLAARLTEEALEHCVLAIDHIAAGKDEGIRSLIQALIQSGLAMLVFGHSSPASGSEHHLSHYWEMEFLKQDKPQVLHGAKVGVSAQLILDFYKNELLELIANKKRLLEHTTIDNPLFKKVVNSQSEIVSLLENLPDAKFLSNMLQKLDGVVQPNELGVTNELVRNSLQEAHQLRNRYTMLKFWNENIGIHHYA